MRTSDEPQPTLEEIASWRRLDEHLECAMGHPDVWEAIFSWVRNHVFYGLCEYGHLPYRVNIGPQYFYVCDRCETYWPWPHEECPDWKQDHKEGQQAARDIISEYRLIEPRHPLITPHCLALYMEAEYLREAEATVSLALDTHPELRARLLQRLLETTPPPSGTVQ